MIQRNKATLKNPEIFCFKINYFLFCAILLLLCTQISLRKFLFSTEGGGKRNPFKFPSIVKAIQAYIMKGKLRLFSRQCARPAASLRLLLQATDKPFIPSTPTSNPPPPQTILLSLPYMPAQYSATASLP